MNKDLVRNRPCVSLKDSKMSPLSAICGLLAGAVAKPPTGAAEELLK